MGQVGVAGGAARGKGVAVSETDHHHSGSDRRSPPLHLDLQRPRRRRLLRSRQAFRGSLP